MFSLLTRSKTLPAKPVPKAAVSPPLEMQEYINVCNQLGITTAVNKVDALLRALEKLDLPVYDLPTVVAYMDDIAKRDGNGFGWCWRPVRDQDRYHLSNITFGHPDGGRVIVKPSSDFYDGDRVSGNYGRVIPLHALKRIQAVTKAVGDKELAFMVSDYATKDDKVQPDPFLMVVVTTTLAAPRYVIDFWDEPNFGLEQMLR